jgi:DNA-binding NtrC family response regulator
VKQSAGDENQSTDPIQRRLVDYAPCFGARVVQGADQGKAMRVISRVVVGSSPTTDFVLSDRQVSRRHLSLEIVGERLRVVDLDTTNGTWLGRIRVGEIEVSGGERITIGTTAIVFERLPNAPVETAESSDRFGEIVGASPSMRRLHAVCARLAAETMPIVIEGETGTGKSLLAQELHAAGPRAERRIAFVECNGASVEELASELDAAIATARGGTLVLDDVDDVPMARQSRVLRALEECLASDVRVIATTKRDLDREVQAGRFREDLLHRLSVARIDLPPLRRRAEDIPLLARELATRCGADPGAIAAPTLDRWTRAPWPGNVRELENAVSRHAALGELAALEGAPALDEIPFIDRILEKRLPIGEARQLLVEELERRYVHFVLAEAGGNVAQAAASSGMSRRYLQMLKAKLGI